MRVFSGWPSTDSITPAATTKGLSFLPGTHLLALHVACKGYQRPAEIRWRIRHDRSWKSCLGSPVQPFPAGAMGDRVHAHALPSAPLIERTEVVAAPPSSVWRRVFWPHLAEPRPIRVLLQLSEHFI